MKQVSISKTIISVVFGLAMWGAAPALAAETDPYANIHTVSIVSKVGDSITIKTVGSTVFGNKADQSLGISDWEIDKYIEDKIAALISGRFSVQAMSPGLRSTDNIKNYVQSLPAEQRSDAYIAVVKSIAQPADSNQQISGLTIYRHNLILGGHNDSIWAPFIVSVMDSKTGKVIDYGSASLNDGRLNFVPAVADNDAANWADSPDLLTDVQKQNIRSELTHLIDTAVVHAVRRANLIQ